MSDNERAILERQTEARAGNPGATMPPPAAAPPRSAVSPGVIAAIGGVVAAGVVAGTLLLGGSEKTGTVERPALSLVKAGDIDKASGTVAPEEKDKVVEEAKACRAPLASMRLSKTTAKGGGVVRIRAGNYLSPAFTVADGPIVVAVPFPGPYEAGKGEIVIEGAAKDVFVQLNPGLTVDTTEGVKRIPVIWDTSKPCGA